MSATEPLYYLIGINPEKLSKAEIHFLEAELFTRICDALKGVFKNYYKNYFQLMKYTNQMEDTMLEANFVQFIINDILSTEEYTLEGIACYIDTPEDVIVELVTGRNTTPSAIVFRRIIELHRMVRQELYQSITKKITSEYLMVA